ncbi:hypothetical protein C8E03_10468 [Lachnotalea glycerini]|jgi:hypothetical protein|uniref:Lipoprotein n=1 Tax=Lachnotalea glycerini TaxID=1763509 RepID=A0A318EMC0_9FIRM|nr:hypothetical protein [Lachnotalea glycerini]OYO59652.1 hypothetical protein CG709_18220 [Lachnotalea glycerini]PXV91061.1 hypothetical protein C8E03_10468 [Lachnotalea glycerini]
MKRIFKRFLAAMSGFVVMISLTACSGWNELDVVGQQSIKSFDEVLKTLPDQITVDETNASWSLEAPDDSARFIWSQDYSKSPLYDVMIEVDATPFINAGLDPDKLPNNYTYDNGMLKVGTKLGKEELTYSANTTPLTSYEQIVNHYRTSINYHTALDHFGVKLGDGNLFEWAKDMKTNGSTEENQDKDIVFVLNSEPLIEAGTVPDKVEEWTYAQVEVMENGKTLQVYKFLKPFDIK